MPFQKDTSMFNCRCVAIPIKGELAMGDEADRLVERQFLHGQHIGRAIRTDKNVAIVLDYAGVVEAEGPREPSTRTTCNRCGTARLHWTGDKQAGTLVMRDEHGFEHKCPTYNVELNLTL